MATAEPNSAQDRNSLAQNSGRAKTGGRETDSGIEVKPVYTADDLPAGELELPGEYPFTRGPYSTMYRGRPWTMRQYAGYGSAEESNARFRYLLERGQTGLSVAFDLPTQLGYDSDDPLAEGEVGRTGVAIDSIADMEALLEGIPLGEVSTSMTINAPAALLLLLYELVAEGQGVPGEKLRGTVQNDVLKEYIARGNYIFPPRPSMRLTTDLFAYCAERLPGCQHDLDLRVPHPRGGGERGPGARVHARERDRVLRGRSCRGPLAGRLRRAPLLLLQRAQPLLPGGREVPRGAAAVGADHDANDSVPTNPRAQALRFHAQTGGSTLTAQQPENNVVRVAIQALSAIAGGAQSIHTNSYDEALALPSERAARIALRTQQILAHEAGGTDTADPLGGAYFIEALTGELETRAQELIERIDEMGGAVAAIEAGFVQAEIEASAFRHQAAVESGERVVVGVNRFIEDDSERVELLQFDPESERRQRERTAQVRAERHTAAVEQALSEVVRTAESDANLLPALREALRARATVGEICGTLRELWGTYDAQHRRARPESRAGIPVARERPERGRSRREPLSLSALLIPRARARSLRGRRWRVGDRAELHSGRRPRHRRQVRGLPSGRRDRAVPARDRGSGRIACRPHRGRRPGRSHAAVASRRQVARLRRRAGANPRRARARDARGLGERRWQGRRSCGEARRDAASSRAPGRATAAPAHAGRVPAERSGGRHRRLPLLPPRPEARPGRLGDRGRDRAGQPKVVHHVILFRVDPSQVAEAQALDAAAPGRGWRCFGDSGLSVDPEDTARRRRLGRGLGAGLGREAGFPDGTGVPLEAGSRIVMQVHYNLLNGRAPGPLRARC